MGWNHQLDMWILWVLECWTPWKFAAGSSGSAEGAWGQRFPVAADQTLKVWYAWELPPTQDSSRQQDYSIFSREFPRKPSFVTGILGVLVDQR